MQKAVMESLFHFDPINLFVVVAAAIAAWVTMRNTSSWHTTWIRKHETECGEQRKLNSAILVELQKTNTHLVTLTEGHEKRIDRLEAADDRARASV